MNRLFSLIRVDSFLDTLGDITLVDALKYLFVGIALCIVVAICARILTERSKYLQETFTDSATAAEGGGTPVYSNTTPDCASSSNYKRGSKHLPLKEYAIKASFNSAYDGNDVSKETLKAALLEGYRFIDLNVITASGGLYVGFSQENAPTMTSVKLSFEQALQCIYDNAFTPPTQEGSASATLRNNYADLPLIVHLRLYRSPTSEVDIIKKLAEILKLDKHKRFHRSNGSPILINGCTPLSSISGGKILFSMDIENILQIYAPTNSPNMDYVASDTRAALQSFVNFVSGGETLRAFYSYADSSITNRTAKLQLAPSVSDLATNVETWKILYPHPNDAKTNPDAVGATKGLILQNSIQIIPMRRYLSDNALNEYISLFDTLKTPFAPLAYAYTAIQSPKNENE